MAVLVVDDPVTGTPMIVPCGRGRGGGPGAEVRRAPGDRMPDDSPEARRGRVRQGEGEALGVSRSPRERP